jgi:hypothetical protein
MMNENTFFSSKTFLSRLAAALVLASGIFLAACSDDPEPVNEEEVITTVTVVLSPAGGGAPVALVFRDADGDGSGVPVKTVSGNLSTNKTYTGVLTLQNESGATPVDITAEVQEESDDHLFCFSTSTSNLTVSASDTDSKGLPVGLTSSWVTTTIGTVNVKIILRHQPGTKTGNCPGTGETDIEIDFDLMVL